MSSEDSSPQCIERRNKCRHDEGSSRNAPPHISSRAPVIRDYPRGRMNISSEIEGEEEEEPQVE
jgi:hypothetical protein